MKRKSAAGILILLLSLLLTGCSGKTPEEPDAEMLRKISEADVVCHGIISGGSAEGEEIPQYLHVSLKEDYFGNLTQYGRNYISSLRYFFWIAVDPEWYADWVKDGTETAGGVQYRSSRFFMYLKESDMISGGTGTDMRVLVPLNGGLELDTQDKASLRKTALIRECCATQEKTFLPDVAGISWID